MPADATDPFIIIADMLPANAIVWINAGKNNPNPKRNIVIATFASSPYSPANPKSKSMLNAIAKKNAVGILEYVSAIYCQNAMEKLAFVNFGPKYINVNRTGITAGMKMRIKCRAEWNMINVIPVFHPKIVNPRTAAVGPDRSS